MSKLNEQWGPTVREKQAKFPPKALDFNRLKDSDGFWDLSVGDAQRLNAIRLKVDGKTNMGDIIFFLNMAADGWNSGRRP